MKTATTLAQYSGLKSAGESTMMKRRGREVSIEGTRRWICNMDAEDDDVAVDESAGVKRPLSKKDLIFDMRRREEADGESRMMGSGRLTGPFELIGKLVPLDAAAFAAFCALNCTASLRTYVKS